MDGMSATLREVHDAEDFRIHHLSELLRRVRAQTVRPAHNAIPASRRAGVTQEQAALMLGMSDRHYRDFERGRVLHPDQRFLDRVASVLGMSAAERDALYRLAARRPPLTRQPRPADLRELQSLLDAMHGAPALITDNAWNILIWNEQVVEYLQDPGQVPDAWRNAMLWMFSPAAAACFPGVREEYRALVGRVRSAYLADGGHCEALKDLIDRLLTFPEAARWWHAGALALEPIYQPRTLLHPDLGPRRVRTLNTVLAHQGLRIIQFIPDPDPEPEPEPGPEPDPAASEIEG
jgi:transcriptional regulator with XRE-family HTH domain